MSQENVEIIKGMIDGWNRGDFDAWVGLSHPEVEWSSGIARQIEGGDAVYRGRDEVRQFWDEWHAIWDAEIDLTEARDLGETVLALAVIRTRGRSSGVENERSIGYVFEFQDGLVRRARSFLSGAEALEAVGLSE
jgi:ketosteroid isomerase-like protein